MKFNLCIFCVSGAYWVQLIWLSLLGHPVQGIICGLIALTLASVGTIIYETI